MGKALYRKYRSKNLSEIVGQDHITTTLGKAIKQGKISHAYLLTGPKGVGKTSVARIIAHEINRLPYSEDPHLDIIEIDAASNRRIDEIRDLRDHVHTAPVSAKYKVYIIDEVHMLTKEAFNALLKTLEEPPEHVVFILATTELHKLPETIVSRTQRYSFRPVPKELVVGHLNNLASKEGIELTDNAAALIADHGDGSFRDSISLLDQMGSGSKKIDTAAVEQLLGRAPKEAIKSLLETADIGDLAGSIVRLNDLSAQGFDPATLSAQIARLVRSNLMKANSSKVAALYLDLLSSLSRVPAAYRPKDMLELAILEYSIHKQTSVSPPPDVASELDPLEELPAKPSNTSPKKSSENEEHLNTVQTSPPTDKISDQPAPSQPLESAIKDNAHASDQQAIELWQQILKDIKHSHNTLYGVARMAKPELSDKTLHLGFKFGFHKKQISTAKNLSVLAESLQKFHEQPLTIECSSVSAESKPILDNTATPNNDNIKNISNIFGGAELLD